MSTDTPTPERVTLTEEERAKITHSLDDHGGVCREVMCDESLDEAVRRIIAAREQALREEIAGERDAYLDSPALAPAWVAGWHSAVDHIAARIARGGAR